MNYFNNTAYSSNNRIGNINAITAPEAIEINGHQYQQITFYKHHSSSWQFCRGIKAFALTILTFGFGPCCSNYISTLWFQALSGMERITELKELTPTEKKTDQIAQSQIPKDAINHEIVDKEKQLEVSPKAEEPIIDLRHSQFPMDMVFLDELSRKPDLKTILLTQPKELGPFLPTLKIVQSQLLSWIECLRYFLTLEKLGKGKDLQIEDLDFNIFYYLAMDESCLLVNRISQHSPQLAVAIINDVLEKTKKIESDKDTQLRNNLYAILSKMDVNILLLVFPSFEKSRKREILAQISVKQIEGMCGLAQESHLSMLVDLFKFIHSNQLNEKMNVLVFERILEINNDSALLLDLVYALRQMCSTMAHKWAYKIFTKFLTLQNENVVDKKFLGELFLKADVYQHALIPQLSLNQFKLLAQWIDECDVSSSGRRATYLLEDIAHMSIKDRILRMEQLSFDFQKTIIKEFKGVMSNGNQKHKEIRKDLFILRFNLMIKDPNTLEIFDETFALLSKFEIKEIVQIIKNLIDEFGVEVDQMITLIFSKGEQTVSFYSSLLIVLLKGNHKEMFKIVIAKLFQSPKHSWIDCEVIFGSIIPFIETESEFNHLLNAIYVLKESSDQPVMSFENRKTFYTILVKGAYVRGTFCHTNLSKENKKILLKNHLNDQPYLTELADSL
ncbi:MAG: hypothetical protein H0W88_03320 [Parachlamydiaceae bacterium]|nr:hypothetical protein [Parachlamydiaceae bacterium]